MIKVFVSWTGILNIISMHGCSVKELCCKHKIKLRYVRWLDFTWPIIHLSLLHELIRSLLLRSSCPFPSSFYISSSASFTIINIIFWLWIFAEMNVKLWVSILKYLQLILLFFSNLIHSWKQWKWRPRNCDENKRRNFECKRYVLLCVKKNRFFFLN